MSSRDLALNAVDSLQQLGRRLTSLERRAMWSGSAHTDSPGVDGIVGVPLVATDTAGYPNSTAVVEASLDLDPGRWVCQGFIAMEANATPAGSFVEIGSILSWDDGTVVGEEITRIGFSVPFLPTVDAVLTVAASFVAVDQVSVELAAFAGADPAHTGGSTSFSSAFLVARPG